MSHSYMNSEKGACLGGDGFWQVDGLHGDECASEFVLKI